MEKHICPGCMGNLGNSEVCPECGFDIKNYEIDPHHLLPGTVLKDRFTVGRVLGEGGFGITYMGWDNVLAIKVAIKEFYMSGYVNRNSTHSSTVIANSGEYGETFEKNREKFLGEAKVLARFSGEEGIVGVRDYFKENNTAYIVMDFLKGQTLRQYVNREGCLSYEKTLGILSPVIKSLGNVHKHNVIHRDISPDNIMLTDTGEVKLLDFGAAREVLSGDVKSLSIILKPGYAPEEQYRSKGVQGPWTDIYALCATIYRCITGVVPEESMNRLFEDKLSSPCDLGFNCPAAFSDVIMKGLAVRHEDRYRSVEEFSAAIEQAKAGLITAAADLPSSERSEPAGKSPEAGTESVSNLAETENRSQTVSASGRKKSKKIRLFIIAAIVVPIIAVSALVLVFGPKLKDLFDSPEETPSYEENNETEETTAATSAASNTLSTVESEVSSDPSEGLENAETEQTVPVEEETEPKLKSRFETAPIPEPFDSFSFVYGGVTYTIPEKVSRFEENGWTIEMFDQNELSYFEVSLDDTVPPGDAGAVYLSHNSRRYTSSYINPGSEPLPLGDCLIYSITMEECYAELPGGYTLLDFYLLEEDMETVLPEGYFFSVTDQKSYCTYYNNTEESPFFSAYFSLGFNQYDGTDGKLLSRFTIYNFDGVLKYADEYPYDITPLEYDLEELRNRIPDEIFELETKGSVISIPNSVSRLLEQGCTFEHLPGFLQRGTSLESVSMTVPTESGPTLLKVYISNPYDHAVAIENCIVSAVLIDESITPFYTIEHYYTEPFDFVFEETTFEQITRYLSFHALEYQYSSRLINVNSISGDEHYYVKEKEIDGAVTYVLDYIFLDYRDIIQ